MQSEKYLSSCRYESIKHRVSMVLCCYFAVLLCWSAGYGLSTRPVPREIITSASAEPNVTKDAPPIGSGAESAQAGPVSRACALIYQGKFDAAEQFIEQSDKQARPGLIKLAEIAQQYEDISQRRRSAREAAYFQQLAELRKIQSRLGEGATMDTETSETPSRSRTGADANDAGDVNDVADVNDVNDISVILSVITKASEFADAAQKKDFFSDPCVEQTIRRAKDKAAELELQGKWLDAYTNCYYWLQAMDPNNKTYSDYSEQLYEKAGIVASFQDSPCETRQERYAGIRQSMLTRSVDALSSGYVMAIDYAQMATEAVKRCELLAEVMAASPPRELRSNDSESSFPKPDADKLTAWSSGLVAVLDEVKKSPTGLNNKEFTDVFEKILALNAATVELPETFLIAQFAEAAFSALDPYTVMIWPRQVENFEKSMTNEFTGIGIEISKPRGLLTVASLLPGTPAYKGGLDAGDVIVKVDGVETKDMSLVCAVRKITGPAGTNVVLSIKRQGEELTQDITITRAKITVPTIRGWKRSEAGEWLYIIDEKNNIGYVQITSFSSETSDDLEKVLDSLESEGLKGLILDLRFNSGGLLSSAIDVTNKFIASGRIVTTRSPHGVITFADAQEKGTHLGYPLVILINAGSASASEIVAGALADTVHERAILVGSRTHGKGSVQAITHYPGGGAELKYTMAYYHLPSDQRVKSREEVEKQGGKDWGIGPDVEIELTSDELRKMIDFQRDNDVLVQADRQQNGNSLKKHTVEETLDTDPQLTVALLVIKTKLIEAETPASNTNQAPVLQVHRVD